MTDMATSVLSRLKNISIKSGRSFQLCLQLFCQEEFLRRLEKSKYAENFVLKGGLFIYTLTNFSSRVTIDIDFLLRKIKNTPEQIRIVVEEIISTDVGNDFIAFEITDISPIAVAKKYQGIGVSLIARIKNTRTPINIDFGVGDIVVPGDVERRIPTQLPDFTAPTLFTYSLETTTAEKIDAILSLMQLSSRMKDYYDIYYLSSKFDFDGMTLTEAIKKTFINRDHSFSISQFKEISIFANDESMQKKWNAFVRRTNVSTDDFSIILNSINAFLLEPLCCVLDNKSFDKHWSAEQEKWLDCHAAASAARNDE